MHLALHVSQFDGPGGPAAIGPTLAATARAADDGGVTTLTLMDHWFQMETPDRVAEQPMLEGYTALGFLAGLTQQIELGLLVTGVTYRYPGLLAKTVATLDVLSGGRAMLGIGAAWYEREHRALGVPFPPVAERFERLEEALEICAQMWGPQVGPYEGRHHRLAETLCVPRPLRDPRPRVLVGGMGEKKTLRLVAQHADACNLFDAGEDVLRHKLEVLDRHCADVGRDPGEVARTVIAGRDVLEDVDGFLRLMERYAALGISQVWVGPDPQDPTRWTERAAELLVPRLREL
ncbi:LLM class F420-dependent oxidoreductase [Pseudokineococcus basanitobsidens]|uniref:LLM class F420-dependent oxidoreductase n=1 Tax=Pseudokineococcus basanitobsidens TaxID=1926649 RepID=A0ABU8RK80_9ACTN